jgi:hypothetical protein
MLHLCNVKLVNRICISSNETSQAGECGLSVFSGDFAVVWGGVTASTTLNPKIPRFQYPSPQTDLDPFGGRRYVQVPYSFGIGPREPPRRHVVSRAERELAEALAQVIDIGFNRKRFFHRLVKRHAGRIRLAIVN